MRSSSAFAVLVVAAVMLVAGISGASAAYTSGSCTDLSGSSFSLGTCYKKTYTQSSSTVVLTMTITQSDIDSAGPGASLQIFVWNPTRSNNAWGSASANDFKIVLPSADFSTSPPSSPVPFSGMVTGFESDGTTSCNVLTQYTTTTLCPGVYQLRVLWNNAVSLETLMLARLQPASTSYMLDKDALTWSNSDTLLPTTGTVAIKVPSFWSTVGYPLKTVSWKVLTPMAAADDVVWTNSQLQDVSTVGNRNLNVGASYSFTESSDNVVVSTEKAVKASTGGAQIVVPVPSSKTNNGAYPKQYDWSSLGPFVALTVELQPVVEFDNVVSGVSGQQVNKAGDSPDYQVYQMPMPYNWLAYSFSFSNVLDLAGDASGRLNGDLDVFVAKASSLKGQDPTSSGSYTKVTNPRMKTFNPTFYDGANMRSWTGSKTVFLAGGTPNPRMKPLYYVLVQRGSCNGVELKYDLSASVTALTGECQSFGDCNPTEGDHPSESREDYSANGDARRFRHCIVRDSLQASDGTLVPTGQCIECLSDCECPEGQYCQNVDDGLCHGNNAGAGGWWNCDPWTNARAGLCVKRNTDPFGEYCRTTTAAAAGASTTNYAQPNNGKPLPVVSELVVTSDVDTQTNEVATGYGFCGELRYYNATGEHDGNSWNLFQPRLVRKVLWSGACVNQVCQECTDVPTSATPATDPNCGARSCINGRWRNNVYVDQTLRTFNSNTVAGTTLAAVMMLILLNMCTCAQFAMSCSGRGGLKRGTSGGSNIKATTNPVSSMA